MEIWFYSSEYLEDHILMQIVKSVKFYLLYRSRISQVQIKGGLL